MNTKLKKMRGAKQQVRQHEIAALALGETIKMKKFWRQVYKTAFLLPTQ